LPFARWFLVLTGSLCAALAHAQSEVTLYGRAYGLVESVEVRGGSAELRFRRVTNQASLLGIRAVEELGAGVAAWAQLESGFGIDETAAFATRNSGVGLRGPWGTLLAGRWDSPFERSQSGIIDPFNDQGLSDITAATLNQGNFARRQQNALQWWSAPWDGFEIRAGGTVNEGRSALANPYDASAALMYTDPIQYVGIAAERHADQAGNVVAPGISETGLGIAAYRHLGPVRLSGQAGQYRRTGTSVQRSHALGIEASSGPHVLLGIYQRSHGGGVPSADDPRCSVAGVGYKHVFSQRTFFIVEYARVENAAGNLCNFGSNPVALAPGQDLHGLAAGLRLIF
jgi:predicted porin